MQCHRSRAYQLPVKTRLRPEDSRQASRNSSDPAAAAGAENDAGRALQGARKAADYSRMPSRPAATGHWRGGCLLCGAGAHRFNGLLDGLQDTSGAHFRPLGVIQQQRMLERA